MPYSASGNVQTRYIDATYLGRAETNGRKTYRYRVSSTQPARDGGVIPVSEWRTDNFRRYPIILAGHDYTGAATRFPIGMADELAFDDDGMIADIALHGQNDASAEAIRILDAGFPIATSVGFRADSIETAAERSEPYTFRGVELLEISLVSVPSDPNALMMHGFTTSPDIEERLAAMVARLESVEELLQRSLRRSPDAPATETLPINLDRFAKLKTWRP